MKEILYQILQYQVIWKGKFKQHPILIELMQLQKIVRNYENVDHAAAKRIARLIIPLHFKKMNRVYYSGA